MRRDPCVYVVMCLNTNLEVEYSVTHLFNSENEIVATSTRHGDHHQGPLDELDYQMQWGADHLNDFFTDLYVF